MPFWFILIMILLLLHSNFYIKGECFELKKHLCVQPFGVTQLYNPQPSPHTFRQNLVNIFFIFCLTSYEFEKIVFLCYYFINNIVLQAHL